MQKIKMKYPPLSPVFFIGASAGGVSAFEYLAEHIPDDFPSPLFFLLHRKRLNATKTNLLPDIIEKKSKLKVIVPEDGELVKGGTIYLAAREKHITVVDNYIRLLDKPDDIEWRPSINTLFFSAAKEYGERAVAILLTGRLNDGVEGLKEVTRKGGITIAQSPESAKEPVMPMAALAHDHPIYMSSLENMPAILCELAQHKKFTEQEYLLEQACWDAARKKEQLQN